MPKQTIKKQTVREILESKQSELQQRQASLMNESLQHLNSMHDQVSINQQSVQQTLNIPTSQDSYASVNLFHQPSDTVDRLASESTLRNDQKYNST